VARCWAYETAVLLDKPDISNDIPYNDYYEYFAPDYHLHLGPEPIENLNSSLESIRIDLLQQLQDLQGAPSVAMHQVPPSFQRAEVDEDAQDPDQRETVEHRKQHGSELYDKVD
jgi:histone deacetylase 1/2